jgi:hypothetical protein
MFTSPFQKLSNTAEKRILLIAVLIFLLAGSCMVHFDVLLKNEIAPLGIISFELAKNLDCATQIMNAWQATEGAMLSAEWSLWFDYIFIIAYVLLLSLILHRVTRIVWKQPESQRYRVGIVLIRMTFFAGFLDMVENFALLQLFYGDLQKHWATLAFATATVKFCFIGIALLFVIYSLVAHLIKKNIHVKK